MYIIILFKCLYYIILYYALLYIQFFFCIYNELYIYIYICTICKNIYIYIINISIIQLVLNGFVSPCPGHAWECCVRCELDIELQHGRTVVTAGENIRDTAV